MPGIHKFKKNQTDPLSVMTVNACNNFNQYHLFPLCNPWFRQLLTGLGANKKKQPLIPQEVEVNAVANLFRGAGRCSGRCVSVWLPVGCRDYKPPRQQHIHSLRCSRCRQPTGGYVREHAGTMAAFIIPTLTHTGTSAHVQYATFPISENVSCLKSC